MLVHAGHSAPMGHLPLIESAIDVSLLARPAPEPKINVIPVLITRTSSMANA